MAGALRLSSGRGARRPGLIGLEAEHVVWSGCHVHILRFASATDHGPNRKRNQDAILAADALPMFAVADGTGGESAAQWVVDGFASAAKVLQTHSQRVIEDGSTASRLAIGAFFENAFAEASQTIKDKREAVGGGALAASAVAATVIDRFGYIAHVGDARAYLWRGGELRCLTTDHTLAMLQLQRGEISPAEYQNSPFRHTLSQALGISPELNVDIAEVRLMHGDVIVMCSNGLTRVVSDSNLQRTLGDVELPDVPTVLIKAARASGGKDNVSVVVFEIGADNERTEPAVANAVDIVRQVFLFRLLSEQQWLSIAPYIEEKSYKDGQIIYRAGDDSEHFYIVGDGTVKLKHERKTVSEAGGGGAFGELALAGPNKRVYTAVAVGNVVCFSMSRSSFLKIVNHKPILGSRLSLALIRGLAERVTDAHDKMITIRAALGN